MHFPQPLMHLGMFLFTKTPRQGAQTSIYCSVAREVEGQDGAYFDNCCMKKPAKQALRDDDCLKLWDYSKEVLMLK